jgi:hypothetical protein
MPQRKDDSPVTVHEDSGKVELTIEEYERLLSGISAPNRAPAVEEGPHLKNPEVRAAKRGQLEDYGVAGDEDWMTDDMKAVLKGRG